MFGWEADTVDFGDGDSWMWRLPGYVEFLERFDPDLRQRQASAGAPAGFEDAIGWMLPITSEQLAEDVPPHWSITFAVGDTDAVADRTAKLGGEVMVPR